MFFLRLPKSKRERDKISYNLERTLKCAQDPLWLLDRIWGLQGLTENKVLREPANGKEITLALMHTRVAECICPVTVTALNIWMNELVAITCSSFSSSSKCLLPAEKYFIWSLTSVSLLGPFLDLFIITYVIFFFKPIPQFQLCGIANLIGITSGLNLDMSLKGVTSSQLDFFP